MEKYRSTEKYRDGRRRYEARPDRRAAVRAYARSEKGKAVISASRSKRRLEARGQRPDVHRLRQR